MSNQQKYEQNISKITKTYLQDALQECQKCWDLTMKDKCSQNCDKDYIFYQRGKRVLKQKLQQCLSNADENTKTIGNCYGIANNDIISLEKFVKRVSKSEQVINS